MCQLTFRELSFTQHTDYWGLVRGETAQSIIIFDALDVGLFPSVQPIVEALLKVRPRHL